VARGDLKPPKMMKPPEMGVAPNTEDRRAPDRQQVEQMRFGLGSAGPLAQAALNSNPNGLIATLPVGVTCDAGMVMAYAKTGTWSPPTGWLECNGAAISQQTYPKLYNVVGANVPNITQISSSVRYVVKY
jgi:hypothetical protein